MMTENLQKALNEQIAAEMWSANLYLSMSFHFESEGFPGFATWMKLQSQEELLHAYMIANFIIQRGGKAQVSQIDVVPNKWGTPIEVFQEAYKHECEISKMINTLVGIASAEKDNATQDFLWGFVREQVEEESTVQGIIDRLKRAGDAGLFFMDVELGKRTETAL